MATEIAEPKLLLVEGKDEKLFFEGLLKYADLPGVQVEDFAGKEKIRSYLKALVLTPGFARVSSLGMVRDANGDAGRAFQSVCDALEAADLPAPERPLLQVNGHPNVAVMILPGGCSPGVLEDLCLRAVASDPAMQCIEQYLRCLREQDLTPSRNPAKARVQAFLASRERPGLRLGEAAQAGYWPFSHSAFADAIRFLHQVAR